MTNFVLPYNLSVHTTYSVQTYNKLTISYTLLKLKQTSFDYLDISTTLLIDTDLTSLVIIIIVLEMFTLIYESLVLHHFQKHGFK